MLLDKDSPTGLLSPQPSSAVLSPGPLSVSEMLGKVVSGLSGGLLRGVCLINILGGEKVKRVLGLAAKLELLLLLPALKSGKRILSGVLNSSLSGLKGGCS